MPGQQRLWNDFKERCGEKEIGPLLLFTAHNIYIIQPPLFREGGKFKQKLRDELSTILILSSILFSPTFFLSCVLYIHHAKNKTQECTFLLNMYVETSFWFVPTDKRTVHKWGIIPYFILKLRGQTIKIRVIRVDQRVLNYFIEDQAFSPSYDLVAPSLPLFPLSRQ